MKNNSGMQNDIARIARKWQRDIDSFEPQSVQIVRNSMLATRYTSFQYKLVMRILTTNYFLQLIHRRENDLCTFCSSSPETLSHLFLQCHYVTTFWHDVSRYLTRNGLGQLCSRVKIYGDSESSLVTHVVTLAKYIIYNARYNEVLPSFYQFKLCLKRDFETERFIAAKQSEFENFDKKWNPLLIDLSDSN